MQWGILEWLKKYHPKEKAVAVVLHKRHTGKQAPTHRELLDEALSGDGSIRP